MLYLNSTDGLGSRGISDGRWGFFRIGQAMISNSGYRIQVDTDTDEQINIMH